MAHHDSRQPAESARERIRSGEHTTLSYGLAPGFVQCNLVILGQKHAYDFLLYCQRNQQACPLIEVTEMGCPEPLRSAPGADLRTDLPRYHVYRKGRLADQPTDIRSLWKNDFVAFLIGSGITFDQAFNRVGIATDARYRWVLQSSCPTERAGLFHGNLVVTMRWIPHQQVVKATQVTSRFVFNHGGPIHVGDPNVIGAELENPIHGPTIGPIPDHLTPMFWACGVTPQAAAQAAEIDLMITHAPAHGFITNLRADDLCQP